jgi:hypothetical protein
MNEQQRKAHIKKFNQTLVSSKSNDDSFILTTDEKSTIMLSVAEDVAITKIKLSVDLVKGIWQKAAALVADDTAISKVPGGSKEDRYVLSKSGAQPHLIRGNGCVYKCDEKCFNYKSLSICSHVVATAEVCNNLTKFLDWYTEAHSSKPLNLYQAAKYNMPTGAGCKGGKPKKQRPLLQQFHFLSQ